MKKLLSLLGSVWRGIFNELINFPTGFSSIINNVVETFFDTLKNIACLALRVFHLSLSSSPPPPFTIKQCREQKSLALQSSKYLKAAQFLSLAWWIFKHRWYCGEAINIVKTNCLSHSSVSLSPFSPGLCFLRWHFSHFPSDDKHEKNAFNLGITIQR